MNIAAKPFQSLTASNTLWRIGDNMTPHVCDKELPCQQHITLFVWALGIMATILSGAVYGMIDNRNRAIDEHKVMIFERTRQDDQLRAEQTKAYVEIIQRLSRIEAKL